MNIKRTIEAVALEKDKIFKIMGPIIIVAIIITIIIIKLCRYGSFSDDWTNETTD